jgi:hypothetical protein
MKNKTFVAITSMLCLFFGMVDANAVEPDRYIGDTAIYYGSGGPKPNVLFILDNSIHMANYTGGLAAYDGSVAYPGTYTENQVYTINNQGNYQSQFALSSASCGDAKNLLTNMAHTGVP